MRYNSLDLQLLSMISMRISPRDSQLNSPSRNFRVAKTSRFRPWRKPVEGDWEWTITLRCRMKCLIWHENFRNSRNIYDDVIWYGTTHYSLLLNNKCIQFLIHPPNYSYNRYKTKMNCRAMWWKRKWLFIRSYSLSNAMGSCENPLVWYKDTCTVKNLLWAPKKSSKERPIPRSCFHASYNSCSNIRMSINVISSTTC